MGTYLDVSGVIVAIQGALLVIVAVLVAVTQVTGRRRPRKRPQVGDDVIAMVRERQADDRFIAALELELAEMDKRIRGEQRG
jgi:uncharacterized membrane protein